MKFWKRKKPREWFVIEPSTNGGVFQDRKPPTGYIPRDAVEAMGIDCSKKCLWFTAEQSAAMRAHPEWRTTPP